MSTFNNLLLSRFTTLFDTIKPDMSITEKAEICVSTKCVIERFTLFIKMQNFTKGQKLSEIINILDAAIINSIWIIDEIKHNLNKDITNCDFSRLEEQMKGITSDGFKTFADVYEYSISMKEDLESGSGADLDYNDMLLLLIISSSKKLSSMPYTKKSALAAINAPMLVNSIMYISLNIVMDETVNLALYIEKFLFKIMPYCSYIPCKEEILSLVDTQDVESRKIDLTVKAFNYMIQFIMRITDYKLVYEINSQFYDKCVLEAHELSHDIPDLDHTDSAQTSMHSSPANSPFSLPVIYNVIRSLGTFELDSSLKSPTNKHPRLGC